MTRSFSKTYVFIHPQEYSKTAFSKTSSSQSVVEKMRWVTIFTGYVWTVGQTGRGMVKSCLFQCGEVTLVLSLCFTGSSYAPHMLASRNYGKIKVLCIGDRCHRLCTYCLLLLPCFSILFSFCQSLIQSSAILKRLLSYTFEKRVLPPTEMVVAKPSITFEPSQRVTVWGELLSFMRYIRWPISHNVCEIIIESAVRYGPP